MQTKFESEYTNRRKHLRHILNRILQKFGMCVGGNGRGGGDVLGQLVTDKVQR